MPVHRSRWSSPPRASTAVLASFPTWVGVFCFHAQVIIALIVVSHFVWCLERGSNAKMFPGRYVAVRFSFVCTPAIPAVGCLCVRCLSVRCLCASSCALEPLPLTPASTHARSFARVLSHTCTHAGVLMSPRPLSHAHPHVDICVVCVCVRWLP
jgi:hypothetical protein